MYNATRRFLTYVANRGVQRIRQNSNPELYLNRCKSCRRKQSRNPSEWTTSQHVASRTWLFTTDSFLPEKENFTRVDPENDNEIKIIEPSIISQNTCTEFNNVYLRIERFPHPNLIAVRRKLGLPWLDAVYMNQRVGFFLLKMCQKEIFATEIANIANSKHVS